MPLNKLFKIPLAGVVLIVGATAGSAQDYPSAPVKLQAAFALGGPADTVVRIIGKIGLEAK
jgi:tripartite-type tricarboxylate transporter receptor subunit TctC